MKTTLMISSVVALLALAGGGAVYYVGYAGAPRQSPFRTAEVTRGDLLVTIDASGPIEPEEVVDVGAQVAGKIAMLGKDPRGEKDVKFKDKTVDYGTNVQKGMLLAQIDDALYRAQRNSAAAALEHAKADLGQLVAKRDQAEADWNRAQRLRNITHVSLSPEGVKDPNATPTPIKAISDSDYDLAKANYGVAVANVKVGDSTIQQAQAALDLAETNLGYCTIKSPVNGTVIDRRVSVGQTIVSSLGASSLFLLAKDLRRLQVWASVNEADIGRLSEGMTVKFKVAAFPKDTFEGRIAQIRLNAQSTQNVVVYTVVVSTDNSNMKLMPYMTADVKFQVETRSDVLTVPNAALRYQPRPQDIAPDVQPSQRGKKKSSAAPSAGSAPVAAAPATDSSAPDAPVTDTKPSPVPATAGKVADTPPPPTDEKATVEQVSNDTKTPADEKPTDGKASTDAKIKTAGHHDKSHGGAGKKPNAESERGQLWIADGKYVRPVEVWVGATDSTVTEVSGPGLKEGMPVVLGLARTDSGASDATTNPFAPQMPSRRQQSGGQSGGAAGGSGGSR